MKFKKFILFKPLVRSFLKVFVKYILIPSKDESTHIKDTSDRGTLVNIGCIEDLTRVHMCFFWNLLNELGKSAKSSILSLFRNEFNNSNNTRTRILYSLYHMTFNVFCNRVIGVKTSSFFTLIVLVHCKSAQVRHA